MEVMASTTSWDLWISSCSKGSGANVVRQANETTATIWGHEVLLGPNFHENVFFFQRTVEVQNNRKLETDVKCEEQNNEKWIQRPQLPVLVFASYGTINRWNASTRSKLKKYVFLKTQKNLKSTQLLNNNSVRLVFKRGRVSWKV